jgi:hypothetical protein
VKKVVATGKDARVCASQFMQAKNAYLISSVTVPFSLFQLVTTLLIFFMRKMVTSF